MQTVDWKYHLNIELMASESSALLFISSLSISTELLLLVGLGEGGT